MHALCCLLAELQRISPHDKISIDESIAIYCPQTDINTFSTTTTTLVERWKFPQTKIANEFAQNAQKCATLALCLHCVCHDSTSNSRRKKFTKQWCCFKCNNKIRDKVCNVRSIIITTNPRLPQYSMVATIADVFTACSAGQFDSHQWRVPHGRLLSVPHQVWLSEGRSAHTTHWWILRLHIRQCNVTGQI